MLQTPNQEAVKTTIAAVPELRTRRIRELNDQFRTSKDDAVSGKLGQFHLTNGVLNLDSTDIVAIGKRVAEFNAFTADNDPHGEHDFGSFDYTGMKSAKIFWKIDYYTPDLKHGSPDPADPTVTCRVLTIMLSSEY
jgi:hypothetical protein